MWPRKSIHFAGRIQRHGVQYKCAHAQGDHEHQAHKPMQCDQDRVVSAGFLRRSHGSLPESEDAALIANAGNVRPD